MMTTTTMLVSIQLNRSKKPKKKCREKNSIQVNFFLYEKWHVHVVINIILIFFFLLRSPSSSSPVKYLHLCVAFDVRCIYSFSNPPLFCCCCFCIQLYVMFGVFFFCTCFCCVELVFSASSLFICS